MKKQFVKILIFMLVCAFGIGTSAYAFTTGYSSFAQLYASEEATDYAIKANDRGKATTILAIHGGGIERGTSELVEALNGYGKYNTYLFEGLKATDNGSLFIKAIDFDEPKATNLVKNSDYTVSVIGAAGDDEITYIGGQNKLLAELIRLHLITKGYKVKTLSVPDRIAGVMNSNIVNKNKLFNDDFKLGGVQIAISKGLRDKLVADSSTLNDYSSSINSALSESWPVIVRQMRKITESNGKYKGFLSMFNSPKRNFDKKVNQVLAKGAKTPQELIEDAN
ncbi:hypothetical protein F8154_07350 [Alkaliphilus pronyensis]|uniref:Alpha/beta hydrolase n=1 Tax=Alkaliphilus pronyensis TaxID=1482732 RepID=A0A6I0F5G1_9FIRM|nr:poly-gamma-glutamate hydrolase family protein [Alkaliphilus pronyensis]KAB3535249.1 hypothetical protein F8154_07350 [Alkaliphilus pronyensis]